MAVGLVGVPLVKGVQGFLKVFALFNLMMIMALSNFPEDCG